MLKRLEILLASSKANKAYKSIFFCLLIILLSNNLAFSADLNSLEVIENKLIIKAIGVDKLKIKGNDSTKVSIILPETTLKNAYSFNTSNLTEKLRSCVPEIDSIKVVQYSFDPAETRIIIKAYKPIQPKVTQEEGSSEIIISLVNNHASEKIKDSFNKPVLKEKVAIPIVNNVDISGISETLENAINDKVQGDLDQAVLKFQSLYDIDKNNYWAGFYLSLIYMKRFELAEARKINEEILKRNPQFFSSYYAIGIINDIKGDFENSVWMYNKANKIFPEYQASFYRLGLAYLKLNKFDQAESAFKRVLEIYPEHSGALQNLGLVLLKKTQLVEAKNYFKMAIRPDALNNLGNIYLNTSDAKQAVKYFSIALDLDSRNAIICYNLARSYQLMEETNKAIDYYDRALELDPNMSNAFYNKAIIFATAGINDKAIDAFYSYLDLNPDANDASEVLSLISKLENLK